MLINNIIQALKPCDKPLHSKRIFSIPIFIGGSVSIANYLQLGAQPDYGTLIFLVIGGMLGALVGPKLNGLCKERWLKLGLGSVVSLIGVRYVFG